MEIKEAQKQIIEHLADGWGLLTAGGIDDYNTMTIAWGETGTMWWKPVVSAYVVPSRHTYGYMQDAEYFTVSLFGPEYKEDLQVLGTKSGRDGDKVALTKLTPKAIEHGVTFEEAALTVVCKKIFQQPVDPDALPDQVMNDYYQEMGVHDRFMGEIVDVIE
ncbi:MAG: flavin reductase [Eggerthellaceae bacterium]|nr:flavin reductase [Eggerthellaceae bacterium]